MYRIHIVHELKGIPLLALYTGPLIPPDIGLRTWFSGNESGIDSLLAKPSYCAENLARQSRINMINTVGLILMLLMKANLSMTLYLRYACMETYRRLPMFRYHKILSVSEAV